MKTRIKILRLLVLLCSTLVEPSGFCQTTRTWTNATGGDIATAANWSPNGQPSGDPSPGDTVQWNGVAEGPLSITYGTAYLPNTGLGSYGLYLVFTANQVSPVNFSSTAPSGSALFDLNNISIANGAGAVTIGNGGGPGNTYLFNIVTRPAGTGAGFHNFLNNSANTATINGDVRWLAGGGTAYTLDFDGTGNWAVNNYLVTDNGAGMSVQKDGTGTMTWSPTGYPGFTSSNFAFLSPAITINAGTIVLAGSHPSLSSHAIVNNAIFQFDAPSQSQTLFGVISGGGQLQVDDGTLTLSGTNTYSGNTLLNGGELIANGPETSGVGGPLGFGGTISFSGGTLGFSANNIFDYSPRFSTADNQAYLFDTAGQNVTFATGLSGNASTLTKVGTGTLTLSGTSTYSGLTTVSAGKLVFQGSKTGIGDITVADGTALGVTVTGTQVTPDTLIVGASSGAILEFNNVNSTTIAPLAPTMLTPAGTVTMNVNSYSFIVGQSYPLLTWTSGSAPSVALGTLSGFFGNLSTNGNKIQLNITATAYKWSGSSNGTWDLTTPNNWIQNGGPATFANGGPVVFDDSLKANSSVTMADDLLPTTVVVSNNIANYSLISSGGNDIDGSASLTKSGNGLLTLSGGANANTGVTTINGGTLSVAALADGGSLSDIGAAGSDATNLVLNGGALQYTGGAVSLDRLFLLGTAGGTIDSSGAGALDLDNTGSPGYAGNGPRTFTLTGSDTDDNTLAASLGDNGGATSLTKGGAGKWILTGNNTYSGVTTISSGLLEIGSGGPSGSLGSGSVVNNGGLDFNSTGTLTVSGSISGTGSVTNDGSGTVILAGDNSYAGGTTINAGTLQIGIGGATGKLASSQPVFNNGTLVFNSASNFTLNGIISGAGSIMKNGTGTLTLNGANTYIGDTTVSNGALLINGTNLGASTTVSYNLGSYRTFGGSGTLYGPVTLVGQLTTLAPGASAGSIGTLTINSDLSFGGNVVMKVNKSLAQSNDFIVVSGLLTNTWTGGAKATLTVTNLGPALVVGDEFTLFSEPLQNGGALSVTGSGATWTNNLAVDGSISVMSVTVPTMNFTKLANGLQFSWNTNFGTYILQSQTNSLNVGITTNWVDYPGGNTSPITVPIGSNTGAVFLRLISTP